MRFGDGLFETIKIIDGKAVWLTEHLNRLLKGASALYLLTKNNFKKDTAKAIAELIKRNEIYEGGICRIILFRGGEGKYLPDNNEAQLFIEASKSKENGFSTNMEGLKLGVSKKVTLSWNQFSEFKTLNSLPYIIASLEAKENGFDDLLILDNAGFIVESTSSNVFIEKDGIYYTPSISCGCVDGIARRKFIESLRKKNVLVKETNLKHEELLNADCMFICNSISGILKIVKFESKKFTYNDQENPIKL